MKRSADIFQRVEKKYLLTAEQKESLMEVIAPHLAPDPFPHATICSLYLDTPDYRIIRHSREAVNYKEKLRLRSYGTPSDDDTVFLELKKKFDGVVYKRRVSMTLRQALDYLAGGPAPVDSQIMREIDYAMQFYGNPVPAMFVAYERDAWFAKEDPQVRITFDSAARYRENALDLRRGSGGTLLLDSDICILEVKTTGAMPLWLAHALTRCHILPGSFSKYGAAYQITHCGRPVAVPTLKGELENVSNF